MRIIEYGKIKPKVKRCTGCGVTFEYTPYDIKYHSNRFHEYYYVPCPVCGKWCFVNKEDKYAECSK